MTHEDMPAGDNRPAEAESCPAPEFDQFAQLAATLCNAEASAVTLLRDGMMRIKGAIGIARDAVPAEHAFCTHTMRQASFMHVPDALEDERFAANPLVLDGDRWRFYAGVPLFGQNGEPVGALCVLDRSPRRDGLTAEERRSLEMLAGQASLQLKLQEAIVARDAAVTELQRANADLQWAAHHDYMTGLGNRSLLREALRNIAAAGRPAALLAIDVDHFKRVNDSFGHQAGDELLKEIGRRLLATVRDTDIVIRLGGDEFAIVVRGLADARQLDALAGRLLAAMQTAFVYDGRELECRITVGGARLPADAASVDDLVRFADAALYEAKARGRGCYVRFEARMLAEQHRRLGEIARARTALEAGSITPYYQPKVDIADGTLLGVEALLRICDPGEPVASPNAIAAAFEEPELAQAIGEAMLARVLADMRAWAAAGIKVGRVAINASAVEIGDPTYAARLLSVLKRHRVSPRDLEIEIVESVLLDGRSDAVLATVRSLSNAGITIAFDDFGTGYAALSHLPKFPVDVLKIDRSFVAHLDARANQAIVAAMLSMARELEMEVIAEGVETTRQAAELLRLGCTQAQGFLYSRPVQFEAIAEFAATRPHRGVAASFFADRRTLASRAA